MNNKVCLFPKDPSTDFLIPIYECLLSMGYKGFHMNTNDHKEEMLDALNNTKSIVFLGHGSSYALFGTPKNGELIKFIYKDNINLLSEKNLLILSCRSAEFCDSYKLSKSIGFGNMPTEKNDVRDIMDEDSNFPDLENEDIDAYNNYIVSILIKSLKNAKQKDLKTLYNTLLLYANKAITLCLTEKKSPLYRDVADLLQDFKNDCKLLI